MGILLSWVIINACRGCFVEYREVVISSTGVEENPQFRSLLEKYGVK